MTGNQQGMSLVEVLLAMLLISISLLAVAPMFVASMHGNNTGADLGTVGAMALDRMETLRQTNYETLTAGGSVTSNVTGFVDTSNTNYVVRWQVTDNSTPPDTKILTVFAESTQQHDGPHVEITMSTMRAR